MEVQELLPIGAGIASFVVAAGFAAWVSKQKTGTKEMMEISEAVRVGAAAFLRREMKIIKPIAIGMMIFISRLRKAAAPTRTASEISIISFVPVFCFETQAANPAATTKDAMPAPIGRSSCTSILYLLAYLW